MGYSRSPVTVNRRRKHLRQLSTGRTVQWIAPFPDGVSASAWAYKVRECLYIINLFPLKFPELSKFASRYVVDVVNSTTVQARFGDSAVNEGAVATGETAVHGLQHSASFSLTVTGVKTALDIINHFLKTQPNSEPYHYPEAQLPDSELKKLLMWARSLTPPWVILHAKGTNSLTLTKEDSSLPEGAKLKL